MAGRLIGAWNPALDSSGNPINGSKLYTYTGGTTSNLATYPTDTDADAGTNPNTNPLVADSAGRFGEIWTPDSAVYDLKWTDAAGAQIKLFEDIAALGAPLPGVTHRSYLAGLAMSTAGSSASLAVAAGQATDAGNTTLINLASAMTKTTGAWASGTNQGGLDTGAIANSTWYHFYAISRSDTGAVDIAFSLSASAPTTGGNIPAAYTLYRRIGAAKTDGSAHWLAFVQSGDLFLWKTPVKDVDNVIPASGAQNTVTLSVPTGVQVLARVTIQTVWAAGAIVTLYVYSKSLAATPSVAPAVSGASYSSAQLEVLTDTASQVYSKLTYGGATSYYIETQGWIDRRGRDS